MFELRIDGIEDFTKLVRIIRNQDIDDELLLKEAAELKASSAALKTATNDATTKA